MDSMKTNKVLIMGTSGYACEVRSALRQHIRADIGFNNEYAGCFGPDPPSTENLVVLSPYLGDDNYFARLRGEYRVLLGVGTPALREKIVKVLHAILESPESTVRSVRFWQLVHPTVLTGEGCIFEDGVVIHANTVLTTNILVKRFAMINQMVSVGHNTVIGEYSVINPMASISGGVTVGDRVLVGTGANILENLTIGDGAVVGAGSVVTKDVEPGATVVGVPAKPIGGTR